MDGQRSVSGRPAGDDQLTAQSGKARAGRERLVFFIDLHDDKPGGVVWPTLTHGSNGNMTLELFKQCVSLIVATRSQMAIETEYSLCVLLEGAVQVLEFTTDTNRLLDQVKGLEGTDGFDSFDMSSVTAILQEARHARPSFERADASGVAPLVRGILLYGRSIVVPAFGDSAQAWTAIGSAPDVVLDVVYVHSRKTNDGTLVGNRSAVLDFFVDLDRKRASQRYIFEHQLNPKRVLLSSAQLAAHARQRPTQGSLVNHLAGTDAVQEPHLNEIPMGLPVT